MKKYLVAFFMMLASSRAMAYNLQLVGIDHFDMQYENFSDARDPYVPQYDNQWTHRVATNFNLQILQLIYWHNYIHMETLGGVPKTVGWKWELGINPTDWLQVFEAHHSRHIMDENPINPLGRNNNIFPVEDLYGMRLIFRDVPTRRKSLTGWIFGN